MENEKSVWNLPTWEQVAEEREDYQSFLLVEHEDWQKRLEEIEKQGYINAIY